MEYRILGRTGLKVSEIGIGTEHVILQPQTILNNVVAKAIDHDVNYFDFFYPQADYRDKMGRAIEGRRDQIIIAGHLGAVESNGQYLRTRDVVLCRKSFQELLKRLKTDYIDIMMLHYVDEFADFQEVFYGPFMELAQRLVSDGKARYIGISTHDPSIGISAVESGIIDVVMFSINPVFDIVGHISSRHTKEEAEQRAREIDQEESSRILLNRKEFYSSCVKSDTGIVAMKPFAAGWLLSKGETDRTPTPVQCLSFALDRPGVSTVVPGVRNTSELDASLCFVNSEEKQRDYSEVIRQNAWELHGSCMYCNHCLPCPMEINVAEMIRCIDSAERSTPDHIREEYNRLSFHASDCIQCGDCEKRCPFGVPVISKLEKGVALFGN